jgi:ubiquinone/menaquinone biosynthesis C-methylase UbiE
LTTRRAEPLLFRLRSWLLSQPFFTTVLLPAIPRRMRWALRRAYFMPVDAVDRLRGRQEEMVPPKSQIFTGAVDGFKSSGEMLLQQLVTVGGLQPDSRVLDVGSGMGRLAVALTEFLSDQGSYEGLDIVESGIKWCQANISAGHPNFTFRVADVFNEEYNPRGSSRAASYVFPYEDESFDLAVLVSVFTHMPPEDMENYVVELLRVMKPGGRCWATYYLINEESERLMESGSSILRFQHESGPQWLVNKKAAALSVAYEESYVRELFGTSGPTADVTVLPGGWCGRESFWPGKTPLGDQDVVLTTKVE